MINLNDIPGLEAIDFKKKSKLAKELTDTLAVGEKFIQRNWPKDKSTTTFYSEFKIFFDKTLVKDIQKIIKDNLKMDLSSIRTMSPNEGVGLFAITLDDKDSDNFFDEIMRHSSGEVSYKKPQRVSFFDELAFGEAKATGAYKTSTINDYIDAMQALDRPSGTFKEKHLDAISRFNWTLYIDLGCLYFMDKVVPGAKKLAYEEGTAIIMHELGHVIGSIENLSKYVYFTDLTKAVVRSTRPEDIGKVSEEVLASIESMEDRIVKGDSIVTDKDMSSIKKFLLNIVDAIRFIPDNTPVKYLENFFKALKTVFVFVLSYMSILMVVIIMGKILLPIVQEGTDAVRQGSRDKRSDETLSARNSYNIERRADEFVSRHGMGSYLASGLVKLMDFIKLRVGGRMLFGDMQKASHDSWSLKMTFGLLAFIDESLGFLYLPNNVYEEVDDRVQRMAQNNMAIFKDRDISSDVKAYYLKDTEKILAIAKKKKKEIAPKIAKVMQFIVPLSAPGFLLGILTTGRLPEDYEKLFKELEDLVNTRMYYQAAKIESYL